MKKTALSSRFATAWTWFTTHALFLVAPIPLFLGLYLAAMDKVAAGTLAAGIFVVLILLHHLPQMELLKAWGIEAKMRARLNEAEEIMKTLRQAVIASATLTYHSLSWSGRWDDGDPKLKQRIADLTDDALRATGVSGAEIAADGRRRMMQASTDDRPPGYGLNRSLRFFVPIQDILGFHRGPVCLNA